ncbi:MAG: response regulator [Alcanivoracaceae bacterium]
MSAAFSAVSSAGRVVDPAHQSDSDIIHILVVDDSSAIRELLAAKLRDLAVDSFRVDIDLAESGEEAVARARQKAYDLIFLDVEMPGIGGLAACRELKAMSPARVAMLSGMKSAEAHDAGRAAGCDNYLTKPPHDADIRSILRLVSLRKLTST